MAAAVESSTFIGTKVDLWKLISRPVAKAKSSRILLSRTMAAAVLSVNIKVSSAYCRTGQGRALFRGWDKESTTCAFLIKLCRTSATIMNKYGEIGSPCRSPRLQLIHRPGTPFRSTDVFPVCKIVLAQRRQRASNPRAQRIKSKLCQSTESNAFLKSSFRTAVGTRRLWQQFRMSAANTKFSEMHLPWIKPV